MIRKLKKSGLSLIELVVVIAIVALLIGLAIPSVKFFREIITTPSRGIKIVISSALSSARGNAAKYQKHSGIRFQEDVDGVQYMIPIIYDYDKTGLANGFIYMTGIKPVSLTSDVVVLGPTPTANGDVDGAKKYNDRKTFSIIFSPSGNLVIRDVRISNNKHLSLDPMFNDKTNVDNGDSMFYKDEIGDPNYLVQEKSVNNFVICNRKDFESVPENKRFSDFIEDLETLYVNPYTGSIIGNN